MKNKQNKAGEERTVSIMKIISHRGASAVKIENSLESLLYAGELGADMVECDVTRLADGTYVIFHDNTSDCEYEHRDAGNTYTFGNIMKRYFDPGLGKYVDRYFDPELGKYVNATDFGRSMVSDGSGYEELFQKDEFGREIRYELNDNGIYEYAYERENNQIVYYWVYIDENGDRKVGGRAETLDNATGVQRLRTKKELDELMNAVIDKLSK